MVPGDPINFTVMEPQSRWPLLAGLFVLVTLPLIATNYSLWKLKKSMTANDTKAVYSARARCRDDALQLYRSAGYDKLGGEPVVHFSPQSQKCFLQIDRDAGAGGLHLTVIDAASGEILIRDLPYQKAITNTRFAEFMGDSTDQ